MKNKLIPFLNARFLDRSLWTRNFSLATVGRLFSAMGGVALYAALDVFVFAETRDTFLSALLIVVGVLPNVVMPLVIGPFVDTHNPLKLLLRNLFCLAVVYFLTAGATVLLGFQYWLYLAFAFVTGTLSAFSQILLDTITPQIVRRENLVKGNAINSILYPLSSIAVTPVAILVYSRFGITTLFISYGVLTLIDMALESFIRAEFHYNMREAVYTFRQHMADLGEGFRYLGKDPAVRSLALFMATMSVSSATWTLWIAEFSTRPDLGTARYAILLSINSAGYLLGGLIHYVIRIPDKRRYLIAVCVYFIYATLDGGFLLMPFVMMCATRVILGVLGANSANIRMSALQNHLHNEIRGRINGLMMIVGSLAEVPARLIVGWLGKFFPYWSLGMAVNLVYIAGTVFFVLPRKNKMREMYNYSTVKAE